MLCLVQSEILQTESTLASEANSVANYTITGFGYYRKVTMHVGAATLCGDSARNDNDAA